MVQAITWVDHHRINFYENSRQPIKIPYVLVLDNLSENEITGGRKDRKMKRSIRFRDTSTKQTHQYTASFYSFSQSNNQSINTALSRQKNMLCAVVSLLLAVSVAFLSELAVVAFIPSSIACGGGSSVRSSHHRRPCFGEETTPISQHLYKSHTQNPAVSSPSSLLVQSEVLVEAPSEGEEEEEDEVQMEQLEGPLSGEEINARLERQLEKMRLKDQRSKQLSKEVRAVKPCFVRWFQMIRLFFS